MSIMTTTKGLALLTTCFAVTACTVPGTKLGGINDRSEAVINRADGAMDSFGDRASLRAGGAQVSDGVFVAPVRERNNNSAQLPARVQSANAVTIASRDPLNLAQLSERLTTITGIQHVAALGPKAGAMGAPTAAASKTIRPNYTGKLSEVLGEISRNFGVEWAFQDGKIIFRDYVTRQYQVPVIPSVANGGTTVGAASSGYTADFWSEFEASVDGILSDDVVYSISQTTGILTVTAKVDEQAEIRDYIEEVAGNMTQQISFDVDVINVSTSLEDSVGVDLAAVLGKVNLGDYSASATNNMNLAVVNGDISFKGMIEALSQQGDVSVETRTGVTTVNNRPVPVEVIDTISYLASISVEEDEDDGTTERTYEAATEDVGFMLQLYPRIMNTNEIMVEYSIDLSELQSLASYGTGDDQIQLPEISSTKFSQQAVLQNGQTLVLSGFERTRQDRDESSGTNAGSLFGFGGKKSASEERVTTVIMIQPHLLRSSRTITNGMR